MTEPENNLFTQEGCISQSGMLLYLDGKLSHADQHRIEAHLLECELCNEALEGLQFMKDRDQLPEIVRDLNGSIAEKAQSGEAKVRVMFPWQFAAAIVLIICSTAMLFIFLPKQNQEQIFSEEYKPYPAEMPPAPVATDTASVSPTEDTTSANVSGPEQLQKRIEASVAEEKKNIPSASLESNQEKTEMTVPVEIKDAVAESADQDLTFNSMKAEEPAEEINTLSAPATVRTQSGSIETDHKKSLKEVSVTSKSRAKYLFDNGSFDEAMKFYADSQFAKSAVLFDKIKNRSDSKFYAGVSWLAANDASKAIRRLNDYYDSGELQYREDALWYLALAYIREKENTKARAVLNQILPMNGAYKQRAAELLEKL